MDKLAATLFGKTRQAVLSALFENPSRHYYLRQLARATGISPGAIQYELKNLVAADLVSATREGGRVHYRANGSSPVFEELQSLLRKTSGVPGLIREALAPGAEAIDLALVYGSTAKGTSRATSDVDLLVVGSLSFSELVALLTPCEERIGREISPRLYAPDEFRRRLVKRDRFLEAVLRGPHIVLKGELDDFG